MPHIIFFQLALIAVVPYLVKKFGSPDTTTPYTNFQNPPPMQQVPVQQFPMQQYVVAAPAQFAPHQYAPHQYAPEQQLPQTSIDNKQ